MFFHVAGSPIADNLTGVVIRNAESRDKDDIQNVLQTGANEIREGQDPLFSGIKKKSKWMPAILVGPLTSFMNFLMYDLNLWIPLLGMGRDPFGSYMITNIGSLGFSSASVPLPKFSSVPVVCCLGILNGNKLPVSITFDHRRMDGAMAANFGRRIQYYLDQERV